MHPSELDSALADLAQRSQLRKRTTLSSPQGVHIEIDGKPYLSFASNDYLGLANHPALIAAARDSLLRWGLGSGASPLVTGHFEIHQQAEQALAAFVDRPAALLFGSGYSANLAVLGSFIGRGDAVFADRLNHASLNDGCRLSGARLCRFRHNDLDHLERLLQNTPARSRLIAVDAVYSMDGDEAPLQALLDLARRYDAWLYIDDAHGFGILGQGHGSAVEFGLRDERVIYMATLGKAAGVSGAFVAGERAVIDWLINAGRTYIFSTAHPPALAAAALASLQLIEAESWRRERLGSSIDFCLRLISHRDTSLKASRTPIQPLIIGDNDRALSGAEQLRQLGIWVPAIRPPTVAPGTSRLRISLSAAHTPDDLQRLLLAIGTLAI
jgi:8-amino-7-oxononanoate synthase